MSQFGDRPITSSYCSFWHTLKVLVREKRYLHYVRVLEVVGREDLEFQLVGDVHATVAVVLGVLVVVLDVYQVGHDV